MSGWNRLPFDPWLQVSSWPRCPLLVHLAACAVGYRRRGHTCSFSFSADWWSRQRGEEREGRPGANSLLLSLRVCLNSCPKACRVCVWSLICLVSCSGTKGSSKQILEPCEEIPLIEAFPYKNIACFLSSVVPRFYIGIKSYMYLGYKIRSKTV